MILVLLQNAYYPGGCKRPMNRRLWLWLLWRSHTGKRLKEMLPEGLEYYVDEANPKIGEHADACFPADLTHLSRLLDTVHPTLILACGRIAQEGCRKLDVPFMSVPHPAWRFLSKETTAEIRRKLETMV